MEDITAITPSSSMFELIFAVSLNQCHFVVLPIIGPQSLTWVAFSIQSGGFIDMKDSKTSLRDHGFKPKWLSIFKQKIFTWRKPFVDLIDLRMSWVLEFGCRDHVGTCHGSCGSCPSQFEFAPCGHVWWKELRTIETPRVGHEPVAANPISAAVVIVQVRKSQIVTSFVGNDSNSTNSRAASSPKSRADVVVSHFHTARTVDESTNRGPTCETRYVASSRYQKHPSRPTPSHNHY
jgi:hypothetical protein